MKGIEPSSQAWEARILPLNHTRFRWLFGNRYRQHVQDLIWGAGGYRMLDDWPAASWLPTQLEVYLPWVLGLNSGQSIEYEYTIRKFDFTPGIPQDLRPGRRRAGGARDCARAALWGGSQ